MDQELQKLIRQFQEEKCPPNVLERVTQRISRDKRPTRSLKPMLRWAATLACVFGAVVVWQFNARREQQLHTAELAAQAQADRALVVQQTRQAFAYIGQAVIRAAAHTENALSKEAVPPLRNSFETLKNKVTKPI